MNWSRSAETVVWGDGGGSGHYPYHVFGQQRADGRGRTDVILISTPFTMADILSHSANPSDVSWRCDVPACVPAGSTIYFVYLVPRKYIIPHAMCILRVLDWRSLGNDESAFLNHRRRRLYARGRSLIAAAEVAVGDGGGWGLNSHVKSMAPVPRRGAGRPMNYARYGRRTLGHRSGCARDQWSKHDGAAAVRAIDIIGGDGGHRRPERDRRAEPPSPHYTVGVAPRASPGRSVVLGCTTTQQHRLSLRGEYGFSLVRHSTYPHVLASLWSETPTRRTGDACP